MKSVVLRAVALSAIAAIASAQVPAGGEFQVNTYTTDDQYLPRLAIEPDGDFVIVWQSDEQDGDRGGAFGQRYDVAGVPRDLEFQINSYTTSHQHAPVVATGRRGDLVTVFWDLRGVMARLFDPSGAPIGTEVPFDGVGSHDRPDVARWDNGFVVAWLDDDAHTFGISARQFDVAGVPTGPVIAVNTYTTGLQMNPAVSVDRNSGAFVVLWHDLHQDRDGSGGAVFLQRFTSQGARIGGEFQVNTYTTGDQGWPSVSVSPVGGFVVVWTSDGLDGDVQGVVARRFDPMWNPIGSEFVVNSDTTSYQFTLVDAVSHDENGNFVVVWHGPPYVMRGQRYDSSAARRGSEFALGSATTGSPHVPGVRSDAVGNFVVVWTSYALDGSRDGIFAQRFGGLGPAALTVDSLANQVLEPGETVDMRPAWRNINGAAQTFSGTLTNITGPAGAVYAITDPTGDYGTVPNDTNRPCLDCYAVSVSDPPTRPAVHWDASAVESILPDVQGQQKQWLLHVGRSFTDVPPSSGFYRFVETVLHHGITGGCNATQYCPGSSTTREQMAVFVLVAKEGAGYLPPACSTPLFADVPASSPFCRWIEELARRGVVNGCGGGNYCPTTAVTREQMAVFVLRTLDPALAPPACTTPMYNDVPASSPFCRWIEELTRRNVVTGCGGGNYCPSAVVTREQMGVFISATFGLTIYGT